MNRETCSCTPYQASKVPIQSVKSLPELSKAWPAPKSQPRLSTWAGSREEFQASNDEDGDSELPQGWLCGCYHLERSRLADLVYKGLLNWDHVFLDYDRLHESGIWRREFVILACAPGRLSDRDPARTKREESISRALTVDRDQVFVCRLFSLYVRF